MRWSATLNAARAVGIVYAFCGAFVSAQKCTSLTENILTSEGCPSDCGTDPCVLYSPSQEYSCTELGASGPCYNESSYTVPGTSSECDLTYQCLSSLVWDGAQWLLVLEGNLQTNKYTMAYVTEITALEYDSSTLSVQLSGGTSLTNKGDVKNVVLDQTFFATPSSAGSIFITDVNLRSILSKVYIPSTWKIVSLRNTNLDQVPEAFSNCTLSTLDLSKNYITTMPENSSAAYNGLLSLTELNLAQNEMTNFSAYLPDLQSLNLTGNAFTEIPSVIFEMSNLKSLYMKSCNLSNLELSASQISVLEQMTNFDADIAITGCAEGYETKTIRDGALTVCFASTTSSSDNSSSNSTVGIAIGVAAGVLVICLIAFLVYRRRQKSKYTQGTKGGSSVYDTELTEGMLQGSDTYGSSIWDDPDLLAVRIEHRDVEPIKLLSRGGFGEVWLGLYMNENVAIKRLLNEKKTMTEALAFAVEIKTMARLEHPKIVRFIGVSWTNALTIQAVTEFMDCGDLKSLLDSNRSSSLTWANLKCQIAIDVADALVYLHTLNPKLIHRDLKSRNVLIDAQTGAKLSDFGISRNRSMEETMTAGVGTARWIAPEVILGGNYTEFADIYSFGVVLSELDTCKAPFHDATNTNGTKLQDVTILQLVSAGKLQPSFSDSCPESILRLARACLEFDPAQRPNAIHISYELRKILKEEL